jgi:large subunit ribosomal protein L5
MSIRDKYNKKVIAEMKEKFGLQNALQVPRLEKVVVNVGIGKFLKEGAVVEDIAKSLAIITGQKPLATKARQSIAGFKTREGQEIGMKTTLRGKRMWDFLDRLVGAALPRVRDFHGLKLSAVDGSGNMNIGIKEHLIFPEILPEHVKNIFPFQVTIVTTVNDKEKGLELFKLLGFPLEV